MPPAWPSRLKLAAMVPMSIVPVTREPVLPGLRGAR